MKEIETLQKRLNDIEFNCHTIWEQFMDKADEDIPFEIAWDWYKNQPLIKEQEYLRRQIRKLKEATLEPLPDYGTHMTLQEFISLCNHGMFIDSDGSGRYATKTEMTDVSVYPSDITTGNYRKDYSHVIWFNK